jgi:aminoglycoside 3-N-acetyltransferase
MISYHSLISAFKSIGLQKEIPVLALSGSSIFDRVKGGTATVMGALLSTVDNVMLPAFTFSTMVTPENGPEGNDIDYGMHSEKNLDAKIFSHTLPSECGNQEAIEMLKEFSGSYRSSHPIFSFYGLGLDIVLLDHAADKPYLPIKKIMDLGGWILLIGADPSQNFSIHYAEFLSGRKQVIRWALTPDGISECPYFPGCPNGFHKLDFYLHNELKEFVIDEIKIQGVSIKILVSTASALLKEDPFALLCNDLNCVRCNLVRDDIREQISNHWKPETQKG